MKISLDSGFRIPLHGATYKVKNSTNNTVIESEVSEEVSD